MIFIDEFIRCMNDCSCIYKEKRETISEYEIKFLIKYCNLKSEIDKYKHAFKLNQSFDFRINFDLDGEAFSLAYGYNFDEILDDMDNYLTDTDEVDAKLVFRKDKVVEYIPIIEIELFFRWLNSLTVFELLENFSKIISSDKKLVFWVNGLETPFSTPSFSFINESGFKEQVQEPLNRKKLVEQRHQIAQIDFFNNCNLMPQDFDINIGADSIPSIITEVFGNIKNFLSLCYICDFAYLSKKGCEIKIYGKKFVYFETEDINEIIFSSNEYLFKIYKWVYEDGNFIDKAILVKTVISNTCGKKNIESLIGSINEELYNDILSNFKLYLQKNLDEYLKLKHDAADKINTVYTSIIQTKREINRNFTSSMFSLLAFLVTAFITNTATVNINIFSKNIALLFYIIILINILYSVIVLKTTFFEFKNINENIRELTKHYSDVVVITEKNLESILIKETKTKKYIWSVWLINLSIFIILALILNNFSELTIVEFLDFFK